MDLGLCMRVSKIALICFGLLSLTVSARAQDFARNRVPLLPSSMSGQPSIEISVPGPNGREIIVPLELGSSQRNQANETFYLGLRPINPYDSAVSPGSDATTEIVFSAEPAQAWKTSRH